MDIVILAYQNMTALDAMGPYEFLSRLPEARLRFVAAEKGPITADTGMLTFLAEESIDQIQSADVLMIPGGPGSAVGEPAIVAAREGEFGARIAVTTLRIEQWSILKCNVLEGHPDATHEPGRYRGKMEVVRVHGLRGAR